MANEKRLIDANAEIKKLKDGYCLNCADYYEILCKTCDIKEAMRIMDDAPTVDAVPVVHGRWQKRTFVGVGGSIPIGYRCSRCMLTFDAESNYCPNCGAKMDGDGNGT